MLSFRGISETWIHSFRNVDSQFHHVFQEASSYNNVQWSQDISVEMSTLELFYQIVHIWFSEVCITSSIQTSVFFGLWPSWGGFPCPPLIITDHLWFIIHPKSNQNATSRLGRLCIPPFEVFGGRRGSWFPRFCWFLGHANAAKGRDIKWNDVFCSYSEKYMRNG